MDVLYIETSLDSKIYLNFTFDGFINESCKTVAFFLNQILFTSYIVLKLS